MLKSHEKFHSVNGKRLVLVVDDEWINREILGNMLSKDYEVIYAADGEESLRIIRENHDTLSLVLLDLMMPVLSGREVLSRIKNDSLTQHIPVIVITSDQRAEVDCLTLGAIDFIPKPFPIQDVILARVLRTIELSEDRQIINSTERDPLTGLYNRDYFYRYAEQFDHFHKDMEMDAIVVDVNHFHMINERYGKTYGDEVLKRIGQRVREMVLDTGGIVCRREADTFLIYCPHGKDYEAILESASIGLAGEGNETTTRVRLRMGVYCNADKTIDVERRFDRAKMATDTIRNNYSKPIALYDEKLHEAELYAEQLADDFHAAIKERQFKVYYQPKFDVRGDIPILSSAEALVRWNHPRYGMISPGIFVPLFEENGMISHLDYYVWETVASQIAEWKEIFGISIPVSVNVSRVDMFDEKLAEKLEKLLKKYNLDPEEYLLEITESAYTDDSELIVSTVQELREIGFYIEMDDFGTGYSSLGMISNLPIDALKLDMVFVRNAFNERKDIKMLELIIGIAGHLDVPVVAEGVETKEQMMTLKDMGCDIIQGFYFSRPVPAPDFERFIEGKKNILEAMKNRPDLALGQTEEDLEMPDDSTTYLRVAQALASDYFGIYYVDPTTDRFSEFNTKKEFDKQEFGLKGTGFFKQRRDRMLNMIYPDDRERFQTTFTKENILKALKEDGVFLFNCRVMLDGVPTYVGMKAIGMADEKGHTHIVIGLSNIDVQMKHQEELNLAMERVNRDALTGVKSRHAYLEAEKEWNRKLSEDEGEAFAVIVCDLNGLKKVNDTFGHHAGDLFIKQASSLICKTFKHSPVYRIGGDEFVAILAGSDYDTREELLKVLEEGNVVHEQSGDQLIAYGSADWLPGEDTCFDQVFRRADSAMYEDKKTLKNEQI